MADTYLMLSISKKQSAKLLIYQKEVREEETFLYKIKDLFLPLH